MTNTTPLRPCFAVRCAQPTAADIAQLEELQRQMDILRENGHTPDSVTSTVDGNTAFLDDEGNWGISNEDSLDYTYRGE